MLVKLTYQNLKKTFKNYLIYIISITLAFSLMFSFNLIANSKDVMELSHVMENFKSIMFFVNCIILFVLSYLINYTIKFMFHKRSKEFGTYMILGIEKKQINKMFLLENLLMGLIALILSFFIGYFFSQILSFIIMNIFERPYKVILASDLFIPIVYSIIYFIIIYFIVLFLTYHRIKKTTIHDLLNLEKKNEEKKYQKRKYATWKFLLFLLIGILALCIINKEFIGIGIDPSFSKILFASLLLIISIYGITFNLGDTLINFVLKKNKRKYKKNHLFIVRQFTSKIKTMSWTLATLSLLILLTFLSLSISNLMGAILEHQIDLSAPMDISIIDDEKKFPKYLEVVEENYQIKEKFVYHSYKNDKDSIYKKLSENEQSWNEDDTIIRLSDYNKLMQMRGKKTISLASNEYALNVSNELEQILSEKKEEIRTITLPNQEKLELKNMFTENYSSMYALGSGYLVIVPDEKIENLEIEDSYLIIDTIEETDEELEDKLINAVNNKRCEQDETGYTFCYSLANISVKGSYEATNKSTTTILSFALFYLAFIFTTVTGAILAIQTLNDQDKYKYRFQVLSKLGMEEKEIHKIIFTETSIFFIFPILYPLITSFIINCILNKLFKLFLPSNHAFISIYLSGISIFLMIYLIYYLTTYFGIKKNLED